MKFLGAIALAVVGSEVAALNLKPHATHVSKAHHSHPAQKAEGLKFRMQKALQTNGKKVSSRDVTYPVGNSVGTLVLLSLVGVFTYWPWLIFGLNQIPGAPLWFRALGVEDSGAAYENISAIALGNTLWFITPLFLVLQFVYIVMSMVNSTGNSKKSLAGWNKSNGPLVNLFYGLVILLNIQTSFLSQTEAVSPLFQFGQTDEIGAAKGTDPSTIVTANRPDIIPVVFARILFWSTQLTRLLVVGQAAILIFQNGNFFGNRMSAEKATAFIGTMGVMLFAGYQVAAGILAPSQILVRFASGSNTMKNVASVVTTVFTLLIFVVALLPVFSPETFGTYGNAFVFLGVALFYSFVSMRQVPKSTTNFFGHLNTYNPPGPATDWSTYLEEIYAPWTVGSYSFTSGYYFFGAVFLAAFTGLMGLYLLIFETM